MGNTFGVPAVSGYSGSPGSSPSAGTPAILVPLFDPRYSRAHRRRFFRDDIPELEYANSYYSINGRWPDKGWILLKRSDYDLLPKYNTNFQLQIDDFVRPPMTLTGLVIVQARCVTRGQFDDPNAIYLVEITNQEGILYNPWFQLPTTSQYNIRSPAYPEQYYSGSLQNGTTAWTWNTMVQDLWTQCQPFLGPYPGLPITPASQPDGFSFPGVPAWEALNQIMDYLGLSIAEDLTTANQDTIVVSGNPDANFTALQNLNIGALEDDQEWIDTGSGRVPGTVVVMFHRRNQYYGTEETVRRDSLQWQGTPLYQVSVAAPPSFANAAGTAYIWADFTVRYDIDGNPLAADTATAMTVAAERATQFFNLIYRGTQGFMRQVYGGAIQFKTGSLVDVVHWFQDFQAPKNREGWMTEIIRGYIPDLLTFPLYLVGLKGPT